MSAGAGLLALALVLAPGVGLTFALLPPGRVPLIARAGLAFAFGYAFIAAVSFGLAVVHGMARPAFLVVYAGGTIAAWVVGVRRHGLRDTARAWRAEIAAEPLVHAVWAALMVVFAAVRLTFYPELNLTGQTALRYWADGVEIADAHRIPALSPQWGHLYPTAVSKVALNSFDAAMSFILGRGPLGPMGGVLFSVSVGVAFVAFALGREFGLKLTAGLLVLLLFADQVVGVRALTNDLQVFRAETFGRLVAMAAVLLLVRAFRAASFREGRREALLAGALFGVCAGTHLVPLVVGLGFAGSYGLARMALERRPAHVLKAGGAALGVAAVVGGVILVAPGGTLGFQGTANTGTYAKLAADLGLPEGFDATKFLASGRLDQPPHRDAGAFYTAPSKMYGEFVRRVSGTRTLARRYLVLVPAAGLAALALVLWAGTADLKATAVTAWLGAAVLLLVALAFTYRYEVYALAQFGPRRLFDYAAFPAALAVLAALETLLVLAGRWNGMVASRPWLVPAVGGAVVVLAAAVMLPRDVAPRSERARLSSTVAALSWIERSVPCSGRVLSDRRTLATFELLTRHAGVLEGMGPYFRPDVLEPALRQLLAARSFFADPSAADYLREQGVAAVVVTGPVQDIGGAFKVGPVNRAALSSSPSLQLVARSPTVAVYRVVGFEPSWAAGFPSMVGRPGYECGAAA